MSTENQNWRWTYQPNGVSTSFAFDNLVLAAGDLLVRGWLPSGLSMALPAHTVTGVGNKNGGTVVFDSAPPATTGAMIEIVRRTGKLQGRTFKDFVQEDAKTREAMADRAILGLQEGEGQARRALSLSALDPDGPVYLPPREQRAGKALMFDADGAVIADLPIATPTPPTILIVARRTIAELRAYAGSATTAIVVAIAAFANGGGATFSVEFGDVATPDDGAEVIVDVLGRRWKRRQENYYLGSILLGPSAGSKLYNLPWLNNVAIGYDALGGADITAAAGDNVAIGNYSQRETTEATSNVSVGSAALRFNTTGSQQAALGAFSLFSNTTGRWNVGAGFQTLYWNVSGDQNTANGTFVLFQNVTADDNTGHGYNALQSVTDGDTNTAVGSNALYRSSTTAVSLGSLVGGSGYVDGTYLHVPMDIVSGYPITPQINPHVHWFPDWPIEGGPAVRPRCDITVSGGVVTACAITNNPLLALSWAAGTVTAATTNPHGLQPGDGFWLTGTAPFEYAGFHFAATGTSGSTIKYALAVDPGVAFRYGKLDGSGFSVTAGTVLTASNTELGGSGSGFSVAISAVHKGRANTALGAAAAGGGMNGALNNASALTAVGAYSLSFTTTGDFNAGLGAYSLFRTTSGQANTALGTNAGYSIEIGNSNIVIGAYVDPVLNNGDRQLNIGNVIYGVGMYDGLVNSGVPVVGGKIGIGVSPTTHEFEVAGKAKANTPPATTIDDTLITAAFVGAAWTPYTPTLGAGSGTLTSAVATGRYKRVGKLYHYAVQINIATNGSASSYLTFTLPNGSVPIALGAAAGVDAGVGNAACTVRHVDASNTALVFKFDGSYPGANSSAIYVTGYYEAA